MSINSGGRKECYQFGSLSLCMRTVNLFVFPLFLFCGGRLKCRIHGSSYGGGVDSSTSYRPTTTSGTGGETVGGELVELDETVDGRD